jgi:hypothetical protein
MTRTPFHLKIRQTGPPGGGFGNTAEPSGELSVGALVAVGELPLAVAKGGWTPVTGPLTEVRTREHATSPLPLPGRAPGGGSAPGPGEGEPR